MSKTDLLQFQKLFPTDTRMCFLGGRAAPGPVVVERLALFAVHARRVMLAEKMNERGINLSHIIRKLPIARISPHFVENAPRRVSIAFAAATHRQLGHRINVSLLFG